MISLARQFRPLLLAGWWAAATTGLPAADPGSWQWLVQVLDKPSAEARSSAAADAGNPPPPAPSTFVFRANATVNSQGVFLDQVVADLSGTALPHLRVLDAPAFGQALALSRSQRLAALSHLAPELAAHPWAGTDRIRLSRRGRTLAEAEVRQWLAAKLQRESVKDKGELELRFGRLWSPVVVPDEPLEIKVMDLPPTGVNGNFILRFELATPREIVGNWQLVAQARIWREVWTARVPLRRGQILMPEAAALERRDVLTLREAVIADPGVRNPSSRREFRGKVQDEQTILVSL